jgi:NitT/TauT family transport system ATP-binding protein
VALAEILKVHELWKGFADADGSENSILGGISFTLRSGQITALLGASGCGKTTLLRILAGLDRCDRGAIEAKIAMPGPKISFVQQGERLLPWRTLLANVSLALELIGCGKRDALKSARKALRDVGLAEYSHLLPQQVSGGMIQRVLLARALVTEPMILLLDEPLGQLDILARQELAAVIRGYVRSRGACALMVTHSVEEAVFIADSVLTLSRKPALIRSNVELIDEASEMESTGQLQRGAAFEVVQTGLLAALKAGVQ